MHDAARRPPLNRRRGRPRRRVEEIVRRGPAFGHPGCRTPPESRRPSRASPSSVQAPRRPKQTGVSSRAFGAVIAGVGGYLRRNASVRDHYRPIPPSWTTPPTPESLNPSSSRSRTSVVPDGSSRTVVKACQEARRWKSRTSSRRPTPSTWAPRSRAPGREPTVTRTRT